MVVLSEARARGFLGANVELDDHLANGIGFCRIITQERCNTLVDLGSGGGVPALVIAAWLPHLSLTLVERGTKRAGFLRDAVATLGFDARVSVVVADAEAAAWRVEFAGQSDVVTARSFGPPATTAEAACRFLRLGGRLIVSEPPPAGGSRWPVEDLKQTGLVPTRHERVDRNSYQVLHRRHPVAAHLPRRAATARKRPLFQTP